MAQGYGDGACHRCRLGGGSPLPGRGWRVTGSTCSLGHPTGSLSGWGQSRVVAVPHGLGVAGWWGRRARIGRRRHLAGIGDRDTDGRGAGRCRCSSQDAVRARRQAWWQTRYLPRERRNPSGCRKREVIGRARLIVGQSGGRNGWRVHPGHISGHDDKIHVDTVVEHVGEVDHAVRGHSGDHRLCRRQTWL